MKKNSFKQRNFHHPSADHSSDCSDCLRVPVSAASLVHSSTTILAQNSPPSLAPQPLTTPIPSSPVPLIRVFGLLGLIFWVGQGMAKAPSHYSGFLEVPGMELQSFESVPLKITKGDRWLMISFVDSPRFYMFPLKNKDKKFVQSLEKKLRQKTKIKVTVDSSSGKILSLKF